MSARVVSMNLCTDSMLFELLEPGRIASVTWLSRDPNLSVYAAVAAALPVNHGHVEEILPLEPDLVVTDRSTLPLARRLLASLGVAVLSLGHANTFAEYRTNLLELADATGTRTRAERLLADWPARPAAPGPAAPRALVYQPNGFAPGTATLMHAVLTAAGYRNAAGELGLGFGRFVALESLLVLAPDTIVFSTREAAGPSLAERQLEHPALSGFLERGGARRAHVPERLWTCAGRHNLEAVALLAGLRP